MGAWVGDRPVLVGSALQGNRVRGLRRSSGWTGLPIVERSLSGYLVSGQAGRQELAIQEQDHLHPGLLTQLPGKLLVEQPPHHDPFPEKAVLDELGGKQPALRPVALVEQERPGALKGGAGGSSDWVIDRPDGFAIPVTDQNKIQPCAALQFVQVLGKFRRIIFLQQFIQCRPFGSQQRQVGGAG